MQQLKSINIPQPCHQSWQQMTPNDSGRHCQSCAKTVTDFTVMTNDEIIAYLGTNHNVCGRFGDQQLGSINRKLLMDDLPVTNKLKGWAMVMGLLSSVTFFNACAQVPPSVVQTVVDIKKDLCGERTIGKIAIMMEVKGHVTDGLNLPMPGATITVAGYNYATATDINGNFILHLPYSVKQFTVSMVGFEPQTVTVSKNENLTYNIHMEPGQKLLGEVVITRPPLVKRMYYKFIKRPVRKLLK